MTGDVENLILEHLKGLRSQVADLCSEMKEEFQEVKHRLTALETMAARDRGDTAQAQVDVYRQQATIDKIKERLDRIERRLELS